MGHSKCLFRSWRDCTPWTIGYGQTEINGVPVEKGDTIAEPVAASLLQQRHERLASRILGVVRCR